MRSRLCRRGQTFTASGELAGDLMGTRSVASSYAAIVVLFTPDSWSAIDVPALLSLAYVSLFSMLIGFVFWYRGLAQGELRRLGSSSFSSLFWTAACLSDSARESGLGTRSSKYRRYHVRCSSSAICKVRQTFIVNFKNA